MEICYKPEDYSKPGEDHLCQGITEINKDDYKAALAHFEKGCLHNNEYALVFAGFLLYIGFGNIRIDPKKALEYYKKAANKYNNCVAQYMLGMAHFDGHGGYSLSYRDAIYWFKKSAASGWNLAQTRLGLIYAEGYGVVRNEKIATLWFEKVVARENEKFGPYKFDLFGNNQFKLNIKKVDKKLVNDAHVATRVSMTNLNKLAIPVPDELELPSDLKEHTRTSTEFISWYLMSNPFLSIPNCQYNLGMIYNKKPGTSRDLLKTDKGATYLLKAAENDHPFSQYHIGLCYEQGSKILKKDYAKALYWYKKSEEQGNADAAYRISCMYRDGLGVPKSEKKADEYFQEAADVTIAYDEYMEMRQAFQTMFRDQFDSREQQQHQQGKGPSKRSMQ